MGLYKSYLFKKRVKNGQVSEISKTMGTQMLAQKKKRERDE